jgi:hypothetical protein
VTPEADIPAIFKTTLHVSIKSNSLEVIKLLLKYGIDPNYPSTNLIHVASKGSNFIDWKVGLFRKLFNSPSWPSLLLGRLLLAGSDIDLS